MLPTCEPNSLNAEKIAQLQAALIDADEWLAAYFPNESQKVVTGDFRPVVFLPSSDNDPRDFASEMGSQLKDKGLYLRAGAVWYHDPQRRQLVPMRANKFVYWCLDHVKLVQKDERNGSVSLTMLGGEKAAHLLEAPQFLAHLPEIQRVSEVPLPVWKKQGKELMLLKPGQYNAQWKTLVLGTQDFDHEMPIETAVKLFSEKWLASFPFEPKSGMHPVAVALAAMLAPFCELIVPSFAQRPCFIFTANREGAGKTLLARLCLVPVHGKTKITPPPESSGEEIKKMLGSVAMAGEPYVLFDNWKGRIANSALEAFVTSNIWSDRRLGASELFSAEKSCLVFITGNEAKVSPDMRRRSLFVELFIEHARAEDRPIKWRFDEDDILENRAEILGMLWAFMREWAERGFKESTHDHGTFGKWGKFVGGIVEAIGFPSPLGTMALQRGGDDDLAAFQKLIEEVLGDRDKEQIASGGLMDRAREMGLFSFLAEQEPEGRDLKSERATWGRVITRFTGTLFPNGLRFDQTEHASRANRRCVISRT